MPPLIRAHAERFSGLLTDFYELTMAAGYVESGLEARATFDLFVRSLPEQRKFLVAAGLDQALEFLESIHFSDAELSYLQSMPLLRDIHPEFFERLRSFHFSGDVWALPEGTIFFPGEPLLRVTAPVLEAQLVETGLLAILNLQTVVASKAARIITSASGRPVIEFGSRRAHGTEAGVLAARAAYIGGCEGTSNTFAGFRFGIPVFGTQAHSWIMAHRDEATAFKKFLDVFPEGATILVDTYNVRDAIEKLIALGRKPKGVRLDSGDLLADSIWVRQRLDRAGWRDVKIFCSGDLDEHRIAALLRNGACVDSFGVGTALSTSSDAPSLGVIYKLAEIECEGEIRGTAKFSLEKKTYPGRKQVFRRSDEQKKFCGDIVGLEEEVLPGTTPLLVQVMRQGSRTGGEEVPAEIVRAARQRFLEGRARLPAQLLSLEPLDDPYPVRYSAGLEALCDQVQKRVPGCMPVAGPFGVRANTSEQKTIFWAEDIQVDFMLPDGRLYAPGAEKIVPNVARLVEAVRQGRVFLASSADAHSMDDPEFRRWPPHCVKGSPGAELIPEARAHTCLVVPNQAQFPFPADLDRYQQVLLEKNTLDVFDNPNTDALLDLLRSGAAPASIEFVVFGVVTECCVRIAAEGLLDRGYRVALVTDAIQPFEADAGRKVLSDLRSRGARLLTTGRALAMVAAPLVRQA
jgi:nicotinate phosphoribosyltransferase